MFEVFTFAALVVGGIFIKEYINTGADPLLLVLLFGTYTLMVATSTNSNASKPPEPQPPQPVPPQPVPPQPVPPQPVPPQPVPPQPVPPQPVPPIACGKQGKIPQNYIIGGKEAYPGKWPWMAFITKTTTTGIEQSGGFLVNDRWVVTCAHTNPDKTMSVMLGAFDLSQQETTRITASVEKAVVHPDFNQGTPESKYQLNDIALIKLSGPVAFTGFIQPICLPASLTDPGTSGALTVAGWGLDETNLPTDKLKDVAITSIANPICASFYKSFTGLGQLCLGNQTIAATDCKGDSGGPVMTEKNGLWTAVGIVSYGFVDCSNLRPSVYTDVAYYLDFINKTIAAG
jgi:secreted trypsin-like serine protease